MTTESVVDAKPTANERPAAPPLAGWTCLGAVTSCRREARGLLLGCGEATVRIRVEREGIIRVRAVPHGRLRAEFSWAVVPSAADPPDWSADETPAAILLRTPHATVRIAREPCRLEFTTPPGEVLCSEGVADGAAFNDARVACWTRTEAAHFFGLGEKGMPFDKRGTVAVNWNTDDYEHDTWSDPLYQSHPFVIGMGAAGAFGLFFDNPWRSWFDLCKSWRGTLGFGADGGELNYYFIPGPRPAEVVQRYAALVGTTPLPPLWALGYQQCRWSYESAARVWRLAREFRRRRIPCDVVYLDIDYMDGYRCFTWDAKRFPDPRRLIRELARKGFRVVTILDPGIRSEPGYAVYDSGLQGHHFCRRPDGSVYVGKVWPGPSVFPDFTRESTRQWWGALYRGLASAGVAGFWNDMNEPADFDGPGKTLPLDVRFDNAGQGGDHRAAHNVYGMQMARATFEGVRKLRPGERPFVLTRAGFSGVQRFAAVWTGDNASRWEHLRLSVPMLLNMGLSGMAFCGADVGGFREKPTPELYTRWLQLGVFYPLYRTHTAGGPDQEPWSFGMRHEKLNRAAIDLRYRLLAYLYTEMQHAAQTGLPVLRPLLLDFPDWSESPRTAYEFMFGRQLYVAPVLEPGARRRTFKLPPGAWYGFFDGRPFDGGREHEIAVGLDSIPVFARAGAVVPVLDVAPHTDAQRRDEVRLLVFPGSGGGWRYADDGHSDDYRRGRFTLEQYETVGEERRTTFRLVDRTGGAEFAPRRYAIQFVGVAAKPQAVSAGTQRLTAARSVAALRRGGTGYVHDRRDGSVLVCLPRARLEAAPVCVEWGKP